jgi:cytidylate kinase
LTLADGATYVDTTDLSIAAVVDRVMAVVDAKMSPLR